jgi:pimeloyl-ACP methyl ester carboxylesterase
MADVRAQFLDVGTGAARRRIAYVKQPGGAPGLLWLQGFRSDMAGTKAEGLGRWAGEKGLACTRFDYSGHGQSGGRFEQGTIGRWLEEAREVFARLTAGPQVVVGSSMGGYIALLLLRQLMSEAPAEAVRIKALVLIAPAWDMTEDLMWKQFPDDARQALARDGVWLRPSQYGDPYPITRRLIEEGRNHLLARRPWDPGRPVAIMHGLLDPDVPWTHTLELKSFLTGGWVSVTAVADGEHRLSRPADLELLFAIIDGVIAGSASRS